MTVLQQYLDFVEARHRVWAARQLGQSQPWTADPVLATRKFTNVFRVLDPGSQFVFELADPSSHPRDVLARLFLYRYTNRPATWHHVRHALGRWPGAEEMLLTAQVIKDLRDNGHQQVFSGAYMILPQPNRPGDKVDQACQLADRWVRLHADDFLEAADQPTRYAILRREYGVGPFMAMQILTDWGYTDHCGRDREHQFVVAGPGAIKGAKAAFPGRDALRAIGLAYTYVHTDIETPTLPNGRTPSLMDIQNTLCEFSKYVRYADRAPGKPYRPAHPGTQPTPTLPGHWQH